MNIFSPMIKRSSRATGIEAALGWKCLGQKAPIPGSSSTDSVYCLPVRDPSLLGSLSVSYLNLAHIIFDVHTAPMMILTLLGKEMTTTK